MIDPVRGVTKKEGHSPHHKVQMRTSEQVGDGCIAALFGRLLGWCCIAQCNAQLRQGVSVAAAACACCGSITSLVGVACQL